MTCYQCEYFKPHELVCNSTLQVLELKGLPQEYVYKLFDSRLLLLMDFIRLEYGSIIVNTWFDGGDRSESGLRIPGMTTYSPTSQHTFGRAFDGLMKVDPNDVIKDFECGYHNLFLYRNSIQVTFERNVSWLHVDTRNNDELVNFFNE